MCARVSERKLTEKLSEMAWRLRAASMVVVNLYRMTAITPAAMPPRSACTGDGGAPGSIEAEPIAFKLATASSFKPFALVTPVDLTLCNNRQQEPRPFHRFCQGKPKQEQ